MMEPCSVIRYTEYLAQIKNGPQEKDTWTKVSNQITKKIQLLLTLYTYINQQTTFYADYLFFKSFLIFYVPNIKK